MKNLATDLVGKARERVRPMEVKTLKLADRTLSRLRSDLRRRLEALEPQPTNGNGTAAGRTEAKA
jgi:hypothetical protein